MNPVVNVIGNQVAWMMGGIIATELVFAYPGIGMLLVSSIIARDAPLVAGICLLITVTFILNTRVTTVKKCTDDWAPMKRQVALGTYPDRKTAMRAVSQVARAECEEAKRSSKGAA